MDTTPQPTAAVRPLRPSRRVAHRAAAAAIAAIAAIAATACTRATPAVAAKPLYRDPVYDGAADPVVVWNPAARRWTMLYTNRRANAPGLSGVAWVHDTRIGLAESADGGATWTYVDTAAVDDGTGLAARTHWAPDVIRDGDRWHMFLTVVPGVFENWDHPRTIVRLTSTDLRRWSDPRPLRLPTDRAIDASVVRLADGGWRLWYNDERDRKSIHVADSPDLLTWTHRGQAVGDQGGEGPKVFRWRGAYWMITDVWRGLAVYRSDDALRWTRQPGANLLERPGLGPDDRVPGGHADVVVSGDRAYLFYFTHPGRTGGGGAGERTDGPEQRRSSIQVVELEERDGLLFADRDRPVPMRLVPPR